MGNGYAQCGSCGAFAVFCYCVEKGNLGFLSQGSEDGSDKQGSEQAEGHGA